MQGRQQYATQSIGLDDTSDPMDKDCNDQRLIREILVPSMLRLAIKPC